MTLQHVPIIDIEPFRNGDAQTRQEVAREVNNACRDIGFLVLRGHGVDPQTLEHVHQLSRAFFDLPMDERRRVERPAPDVTRGYIGLAEESLARSQGETTAPGDLNESFMIGPINVPDTPYYRSEEAGNHFHPNLWPEQPEGFRAAYENYFREMSELAQTIMRVFALALDLPEHYFDDKIDAHISRLRVRNYPAPTDDPDEGQLRVGPHSDYGSLTILKTEDNPGGLQVRNQAGEWVDVPIEPDCFVINIGELLARWTNDYWRATLHRVKNPPPDQSEGSRRQSIVFFHNPNYDAEIACLPTCLGPGETPKFEATTSGGHLRGQFVRTQAE